MEKAEPLRSRSTARRCSPRSSSSRRQLRLYLNGKTVVTVDGKAVSVQIGMNMTVVGSKDAARE